MGNLWSEQGTFQWHLFWQATHCNQDWLPNGCREAFFVYHAFGSILSSEATCESVASQLKRYSSTGMAPGRAVQKALCLQIGLHAEIPVLLRAGDVEFCSDYFILRLWTEVKGNPSYFEFRARETNIVLQPPRRPRSDDAFIALGGDSAAAVRVAAAAAQRGLRVSAASLLSSPTLAEVPSEEWDPHAKRPRLHRRSTLADIADALRTTPEDLHADICEELDLPERAIEDIQSVPNQKHISARWLLFLLPQAMDNPHLKSVLVEFPDVDAAALPWPAGAEEWEPKDLQLFIGSGGFLKPKKKKAAEAKAAPPASATRESINNGSKDAALCTSLPIRFWNAVLEVMRTITHSSQDVMMYPFGEQERKTLSMPVRVHCEDTSPNGHVRIESLNAFAERIRSLALKQIMGVSLADLKDLYCSLCVGPVCL
ncbi:hypothetical protein AK812_SmicGene17181 [Symbiodinium microadriaticum]|uniref:Carrier domain-containing protein n=1 Tax=Symbiodinium microadriaticum TaxID=2951 RepID=A0A1Q9DYD1_SYMMI|nr:hypothetical protein AK812_SmicGene17181 [Symbiodinium microadriaticum]